MPPSRADRDIFTLCGACRRALVWERDMWTHVDRMATFHRAEAMPAFTDSRAAADVVMRVELILLWGDMAHARSFAYDQTTRWSMECDSLGRRIAWLTHMAGPVRWQDIVIPFLFSFGEYEGGGYRETAERIGVPCDWPDNAEELRAAEIAEGYLRGMAF
ncbi:hypothetical protein SEA_MOLLYMUR_9 [Gordonia phage Mollymur]|uniref:Uncharacterized protein n=1 Tax=Gordonia phage Mollymur TaxID=2590895 RepID=A0A4Y6E9L1_9CAUD|nr:hypothetical protein PQB84_gp009 [Gordonia phage Mollymur]QDF15371.1 hypothetical protein SEA_MOLLYMUR_9 [Gordonia phage Mollymur]